MTAWTILIATLGRRQLKLRVLLDSLMPQVQQAGGAVTVLALFNNGERTIGEYRQALLDSATGRYVCFVDDDDELPDYYVDKILPLLDGVDYIGWRMQTYENDVPLLPTFHSLRHSAWCADHRGHYRDISHLNPVRRDLTEGTTFAGRTHEDSAWADQMRGRLRSEHFIPDVMYRYRYSHLDSVQHDAREDGVKYPRPEVSYPYFSWHPESSE